MKILVSGANGFIGIHLIARLLQDGHVVCAIARPSTNLDIFHKQKLPYYIFDGNVPNLISFMRQEYFDGVIHLASRFLPQHKPEDLQDLLYSNVIFATSLLEAAVGSETGWFINTGTFWQHYRGKKYSPVNLYAATKQAFEAIAAYYAEASPINFVTIKLSDTFGPHDTRPKLFGLWKAISETRETLDMSPGHQILDISYIDNVIDGYLRIIALLVGDKKVVRGKIFAIRAPKTMTLRQLATLFQKVTHRKLNINWGKRPYRPREVMTPWNKGKRIPGWKPRVSLEEGLRRTLLDQ